ncbi:MAG: hypothetical protein BRD55_01630 [Bacteroidetes bacterium SW_9_63_38]|nr:MAG: hypothetical protein BRD55_01630 [Bacteroidetes bacterium SW_9_63_38]
MESFVQAIVAGGLTLLAGLWLYTLSASSSVPGLVGLGLVVLVQLQTIFWGKQFAIAPSSSLRYGRTRSVQSWIA